MMDVDRFHESWPEAMVMVLMRSRMQLHGRLHSSTPPVEVSCQCFISQSCSVPRYGTVGSPAQLSSGQGSSGTARLVTCSRDARVSGSARRAIGAKTGDGISHSKCGWGRACGRDIDVRSGRRIACMALGAILNARTTSALQKVSTPRRAVPAPNCTRRQLAPPIARVLEAGDAAGTGQWHMEVVRQIGHC